MQLLAGANSNFLSKLVQFSLPSNLIWSLASSYVLVFLFFVFPRITLFHLYSHYFNLPLRESPFTAVSPATRVEIRDQPHWSPVRTVCWGCSGRPVGEIIGSAGRRSHRRREQISHKFTPNRSVQPQFDQFDPAAPLIWKPWQLNDLIGGTNDKGDWGLKGRVMKGWGVRLRKEWEKNEGMI